MIKMMVLIVLLHITSVIVSHVTMAMCKKWTVTLKTQNESWSDLANHRANVKARRPDPKQQTSVHVNTAGNRFWGEVTLHQL